MRQILPKFLISHIILVLLQTSSFASQLIERSDLEEVFSQSGVRGAFVLFTPANDRLVQVNSKRAAKRYFPASTFKIANSLIALEAGVVKDENEIVPYGGKPQPIKSWERDMSMRHAIKISNVPVYQEIARRVGKGRYLEWMERLEYGNMEVGDDVQTFWLQGPLKISAVEQVKFLARLVAKKLPTSDGSQSTVTDILRIEQKGSWALYGKTGWTTTPDPDIGWFVGWVADGKTIHTFALNMDIRNRADSQLRKPLAMALLKKLEVF